MMGQRDVTQDGLFYSFNLNDHVPREHLLRGIDRFFDLSDLRERLAPFYSHTGRLPRTLAARTPDLRVAEVLAKPLVARNIAQPGQRVARFRGVNTVPCQAA